MEGQELTINMVAFLGIIGVLMMLGIWTTRMYWKMAWRSLIPIKLPPVQEFQQGAQMSDGAGNSFVYDGKVWVGSDRIPMDKAWKAELWEPKVPWETHGLTYRGQIIPKDALKSVEELQRDLDEFRLPEEPPTKSE